MSGHSKWANIKHRKASVDAKKGKAFTKVAKLITVASRLGGGDPDMNPSLRLALEKGKAVNLPKDNIERAIKKGTGEGDAVQFTELTYEGYAQGGVAILVEALTDNRNRTTPEVRKIFEKGGGSMGEIGCVGWMFKKTGLVHLDAAGKSEDEWMDFVLEAGGDDMSIDGDVVEITTSFGALTEVLDYLKTNKIESQSADLLSIADTKISVDAETAKKVFTLIDRIEDHDDIQSVYSNMELSPEVEAELENE